MSITRLFQICNLWSIDSIVICRSPSLCAFPVFEIDDIVISEFFLNVRQFYTGFEMYTFSIFKGFFKNTPHIVLVPSYWSGIKHQYINILKHGKFIYNSFISYVMLWKAFKKSFLQPILLIVHSD